jgi:orotate phosphoribosyltransferase-like protein
VTYSRAYMSRGSQGIRITLRDLMLELRPRHTEFDAIVVSGLSGIIPGAIVANRLAKQLIVVRKEDEKTHGTDIEGVGERGEDFKLGTPYIVLDDFIAGGSTMRRIYGAMRGLGHAMPVYTVLYDGYAHYSVRMVKPYLNDEPLDQWYMQGTPVEEDSKLFVPYASSDQAGEKRNNDLWRIQ